MIQPRDEQEGLKTPWSSKVKTGQQSGKTQNKKNSNLKKRFQGETAGLENHIFIYGKGMDAKWPTSKEKLLPYIGKKYTMSEATSIKNGSVTLLGITHPVKHATKTQFEALPFWEQEQWKIEMKRYNEALALVKRNLSSCYAIILGQTTSSLRSKLKSEKMFATIKAAKDSPGLFALISNVCNKAHTIAIFLPDM